MSKTIPCILVVDDENSNIMALTHILSPAYTVYAAKNGRDAIALAEKHLPDIVLLDIMMPGMDGYAILSVLKKSEKTRNIPVIFVTGLDNTDDEEKGLAAGAADYITKPLSPAIVKLRIRNQIKMLEQLRTIRRLSMTDQLTDLPNRRSFEIRLNAEWGRAKREERPIGMLVIDVDKFKNYNDTYGHLRGDIALQTVAKIFMQELKRPGDFVARWGGEEFIVLLPNTGSEGAFHIAEQIRQRIEETELPRADGSNTNITVSIGVNVEIPSQYSSCDGFISKADKALYKAKGEGRNKVSLSDDCLCPSDARNPENRQTGSKGSEFSLNNEN